MPGNYMQGNYRNQGSTGGSPRGNLSQSISPEDKARIQEIFSADPEGKKLVEFAERIGKKVCEEGLTRSQIRTVFSESRNIDTSWDPGDEVASLRRLNLLKPKLAYQASRESKAGMKSLSAILQEAIGQAVNSSDKSKGFRTFMELFEAILAYHRSYGGQ